MNLITTLLFAAVLLTAFLFAYKFKRHTPLPDSKPSFCLLPKYAFAIQLPAQVCAASDPPEEFGRLVESLGFAESKRNHDFVRFSRGCLLGDFSVKIAKVNLDLSLPLAAESAARVEYGSFAAFDTGDLWRFCKELGAKLSPGA